MERNDFASSVNRSYYAVFSAARALLALNNMDSKKHSGVLSLFNRNFVKTGIMSKESGDTFRSAKSLREDADYTDYMEVSREAAEKELCKAEKFVSEVETKLLELISEG